MFEVPDDPVPHNKVQAGEDRVQYRVKRNDRPVPHIIPDLPADAARVGKNPDAIRYHLRLLFDVGVHINLLLVFLAEIVGGRGNH